MTAADILTHYAAMIRTSREGRLEIENEDGSLSDYSAVVKRIERALMAGQVRDGDVHTLRVIAKHFRKWKE